MRKKTGYKWDFHVNVIAIQLFLLILEKKREWDSTYEVSTRSIVRHNYFEILLLALIGGTNENKNKPNRICSIYGGWNILDGENEENTTHQLRYAA